MLRSVPVSAGVDDLVPVKRSFVDAARSSSSRLSGSSAASYSRPSSPAPAGGGGGGLSSLVRQCQPTSNHLPPAAMHSNEIH